MHRPSGDVAEGSGTGEPGAVRDALESERRRRLLHLLATAEADDGLTLAGAARRLAAAETGSDDESVQASHGRQLYLRLYHEDVPELTEVGLVEYDDDTGLLSLTGEGERVDADPDVEPVDPDD